MSKAKVLAVCIVWLLVLGTGAAVWRLVIAPAQQRDIAKKTAEEIAEEIKKAKEKKAAEEKKAKEKIDVTGSPGRYKNTIKFHLDSFSGYAILRSPEFQNRLSTKGIRLKIIDDEADYTKRVEALSSGDADMAVITIDALIKVSADMKILPPPASIVAIVDETTGADAVVGYKKQMPNLDALNHRDTKFVLTPNSPSETLARVIMSRFKLDKLSTNPFVEAKDANDVFLRYQKSKPADRQVYVLWEPYVTRITSSNPKTHILVDSSKFASTIVDVIVVNRDFLSKKEGVAKDFVQAYLHSVYQFRNDSKLIPWVVKDANTNKSDDQPTLTAMQARKLVDGIWWKNTRENLAHMGIVSGSSLPHIEDMIINITDILKSTGAIEQDPTRGKPKDVYFDSILRQLRDFKPGIENERVRDRKLTKLTAEQWKKLEPVGTFRAPVLEFARGGNRLTEASRLRLSELAVKLKSTRYYIIIQGHASRKGDLEANKQVAKKRAEAAEQFLIAQGIGKNRSRAVGMDPSGETTVSFVLGQVPY